MSSITYMPAITKTQNGIREEISDILNPYKSPNNYWGGCNLILSDINTMVMQLISINGNYRLRHFILSFEPGFDAVEPYQAYRIAYCVCSLFYDVEQVIFTVHEDEAWLHIHFLVNLENADNLVPQSDENFFYWLYHEIDLILSNPSSWAGFKPVVLSNYTLSVQTANRLQNSEK